MSSPKTLIALSVFSLALSSSQAVVLSGWTFETNTPADAANSASSPTVVAETGLFTTAYLAQGVHVTAGADWTTPAGNGSANALSANEWITGDYFQFASSSAGYENITITFDQTGSNTGPRDFTFSYSTDGTTFTPFGSNYSVINGSWNNTTPVLTTSFSLDLSALTALDEQATIYFRITQANNTSISGATVATGGTGRVDNFIISGTAVVPEPAAAVLGSVGLIALLRRRRR